MNHYTEELQNCKKYGDILTKVKGALVNAGIQLIQETEHELVVEGTKKEVNDVIQTLSIPEVIKRLMLSISEAKGWIYIRKKIK